MMAPSSAVKQTARTALKGKYIKSVFAVCLFVFIFLVCQLVTESADLVMGNIGGIAVTLVLGVFLLLPCALGILDFFRRLVWGTDDDIIIIFRPFSSVALYKRAMSLILPLLLRLALSSALLFLPSILIRLFSENSFYHFFNVSMPVWTDNLSSLSYFFDFLALSALFFVSVKMYLAPFLFVADEQMSSEEAINMSSIISRRTSPDFFWLIVSSAGFIALCLLVVPIIFVLPFLICFYIVHCRFAVAQYNRDVDRMAGDVPPTFEANLP